MEKFISFDGADGFGRLNISFQGQAGVMASDGTASITCVSESLSGREYPAASSV